MTPTRIKLLLGTCAALGLALGVGYCVQSRSRTKVATELGVPAEFRPSLMSFDVDPTKVGADLAAANLAEHVASLMEAAATLSSQDREELQAHVFDRVAFVLEPTPQGQSQLAKQGGIPAKGADPASTEHAAFLRKFQAASKMFHLAPISQSGTRVQVTKGWRDHASLVEQSMFLSSANPDSASSLYTDPPKNDPTVVICEVFIPARALNAKSNVRVPATMLLRFWKSSSNPTWTSANLCVYFGPEGFGHAWLPPLY